MRFIQSCRSNGVEVWSYCLMPNHVHLILVPSDETGLPRAVGEAHRRYSAYINARLRVTGHLFQGRFGCVAMDEGVQSRGNGDRAEGGSRSKRSPRQTRTMRTRPGSMR